MKVKCPHCETRLNIPDVHAGKKCKCLHCGRVIQIPSILPLGQQAAAQAPDAAVSAPTPATPNPAAAAPSMAKPAKYRPATVKPVVPPPIPELCPHCQKPMSSQAVFCVNCGYDKRTGLRVTPQVLAAPPPLPTTSPIAQPGPAKQTTGEGGFFGIEKRGIRAGVLGGVVMMAIAAVWFFVGLSCDRMFFYPPILFIIGIYAVIKGLVTGNIKGE